MWSNKVLSRQLLGATEKDCDETQFRILGIPTEVRTGHPPDTSLQRYRCTTLLNSGISETAYPPMRGDFICAGGGVSNTLTECRLLPSH